MSDIKKLTFVAILLLIIGAAGCVFTYSNASQKSAVSEEKVINQDFSNIRLDSDNARIIILPTEEENAKAVLSGSMAKNKDLTFKAEVKGSTLSVVLKEDQWNFFHFDLIFNQLTLKVYVPEKQYKSIVVENNNGKVQLENLRSTNVTASNDNGFIELRNIDSKSVNVDTDNGKVSMDHVTGDISSDTSNGEIVLSLNDLDRSLDLSTDNGRILVKTKKDPTNVRFDAHVDNGSINILDKYNGDAVIGNGKHLIKLSTSNGSIKVEKY
ncbi:MAG: DUF4097 family beta strand repeat-containing protein [Tuberibacillus sp.]